MPIANEALYSLYKSAPQQRVRFTKTTPTTIAGRAFSSWLGAGLPVGVAPTTAAVTTSATVGALGQLDATGGTQRILRAVMEFGGAIGGGMVTICDRLAHQGGLSGTTITAQITNLPTPALTRKTSGVGVQLALEIYSAIGTSNTGATTVTYKDTAGSTQTAPAFDFGKTNSSTASRFVSVPVIPGGTGVTTAESVQLAVSSATAGAFGCTLYYPLVSIAVDHLLPMSDEAEALYGFGPWFPKVDDGACLFFIYHFNGTGAGILQGELNIAED